MKYLKYTSYIYLIVAVISAIQVVEVWEVEKDKAYVFIGIAAVSVFMFFFRRRFAKKFEDRNSKS
jgi:uncharacterized membrane protein YuzA (DUF378 family)